jgi:uncharacterized protein YecE (DUF72 family)
VPWIWQLFDTVEINATFYRVSDPALVLNWLL